jgi:hypothetical protein
MSTDKSGGPAFPSTNREWDVQNYTWVLAETTKGMSLRDYFAAKAMQGFAACGAVWVNGIEGMAKDAYKWADAMLKERAK